MGFKKNYLLLVISVSSFTLGVTFINFSFLWKLDKTPPVVNDITIQMILSESSVDDLIAMVYWDKNNAHELKSEIMAERMEGTRDKYFLPLSYTANMNNSHFDDTGFKGDHQKDVYMVARDVLRRMKLKLKRDLTVVDFGCGSGWKLVHYISGEFKTIGIETDPAYSFLKRTYPDQIWINSNKENGSLPRNVVSEVGQCDLGISADVIEHFREPDNLLDILKSFNCRLYVISTPKRELLSKNGPPKNIHHVREWTFHEFQVYLMSHGFEIMKSFDGVQRVTTQFHIITL